MNAGATFLVARNTMARHLRTARFWLMTVLSSVPFWIALIAGGELQHFFDTTLFLSYQVVLPLLGLIMGVSVLQDEIEGRTITYLYTTPMSRASVFLGRLLGTYAAFAPLLFLSVLGSGLVYTDAGAELGMRRAAQSDFLTAHQMWATAAFAAAGFLVYLTFFASLRAILKKAFGIGFILTFLVEGAVSKIPQGDIAQLSVWRHVALGFLKTFEEWPSGFTKMFPELGHPGGGEWRTLLVIFVGALVVGLWAVREREVRLPASVA